MLVFVAWTGEDRPESMLIGAPSMKAARERAAAITQEREPEFSRVVAEDDVVCVVAQQVVGQDAEGEICSWILEPTEVLETKLDALEEESEKDGTQTQCSSIAEDEQGAEIRCERLAGHGAEHQAAGLSW